MKTRKKKGNTHRVTVSPGNRYFLAGEGENLFTLLTENGIHLRSDCGGKGRCRKCRVDIRGRDGISRPAAACTSTIREDLNVVVSPASLASLNIIKKADICFPGSFKPQFRDKGGNAGIGIAVDLGTTTIAVYLVDPKSGTVISSLACKNPQGLYGADVISRISYIGRSREKLEKLAQMVIRNILWAVESLLKQYSSETAGPKDFVIVGNPAMIHIFLGISPSSIGVSPYQPQFTSSAEICAEILGMPYTGIPVLTLPLISGFVGSDILAAAIATDLGSQPDGTLLIDLGTNGELILKGNDRYWATSCATGPAFEGANISCGIQAIPGAIHRVSIGPDLKPTLFTLPGPGVNHPIGICGSGIISCAAELLRKGVIQGTGSFSDSLSAGIVMENKEGRRYPLFTAPAHEIFISQKDIRNIQLGKAALISGIEFLLDAAGVEAPKKIIIAGAFGSHLDKKDLMTLKMLPEIDAGRIVMAGNAAGTGAIMCLCNREYLEQAIEIKNKTAVINLADDTAFQTHFINQLSF